MQIWASLGSFLGLAPEAVSNSVFRLLNHPGAVEKVAFHYNRKSGPVPGDWTT